MVSGQTRGARATPFRRGVILAVMLLVSYAYFYEGGGWNQNTRFDLVRAIVERHTVQIDVYQDNTGDKARLGDHFYADKAPGASLTAVPAVAAARIVLRALARDVYGASSLAWLSYVATVTAAGLPAVLAALCVFWISRRLGGTDAASAFAAVVCGVGTPLWAYGSLLYGHALAAGCLAAALAGALSLDPKRPDRRDARLALVIGLAAGWAVVTEFPASIPSALIVVFACWRVLACRPRAIHACRALSRRRMRRRRRRPLDL